jgi:hypothetical protein
MIAEFYSNLPPIPRTGGFSSGSLAASHLTLRPVFILGWLGCKV